MPSYPPPSSPDTPAELFADAYATDASRPLIVWYDDAVPARVELSLATLANWVGKTGNLLQDTAGVAGGDRLALALPPHWFAPVWMLAGFATGMVIDLDRLDGADVAVVGPDTVQAGVDADASELIVCGTAPLGGPFGDSLPPTALDFGAEAPGHGDFFQPLESPRSDGAALVAGGVRYTGSELRRAAVERASALELGSGDRVSTTSSPARTDGFLDALLAPLAVGASVVLVHRPSPDVEDRRVRDEKITLRL